MKLNKNSENERMQCFYTVDECAAADLEGWLGFGSIVSIYHQELCLFGLCGEF